MSSWRDTDFLSCQKPERGLEFPILCLRHKPLTEANVKDELQKHQKGMQKTN